MDTNIIERNESCCSGSITQTEDKYIKSRSEIIDGIVYNINSVFDMTSKSTAEDKLKYLLRSAAENYHKFIDYRWTFRIDCDILSVISIGLTESA